MTLIDPSDTVDALFFQPLEGLAAASPHSRSCPEFPDQDFLRLGVQRVLETSPSGRGFLQEHGPRFPDAPAYSNYFASLRSPRRALLLADIGRALLQRASPQLPDRLADIPELARYEVLAMDGHWHKAASHDPRHEGAKMAVGHFYALDLRRHTLRHMATAEGLHEHDMAALKRIGPKGLRCQVPKGRRVLLAYDKACIDFVYWGRGRRECAVYFVSRPKDGMAYDLLELRSWDESDPLQRGVTEDRRVMTRAGELLRIVAYTDPLSGEPFEFLTNEPDLSPGVVAEVYRRRWNVEKVFDEIKNKLGERKAWGTTLDAKTAQANLVAITHNLLVLYESRLEAKRGVCNRAEDARRAKRAEAADQACAAAGTPLSPLVLMARGATQRSVKFIRWVRQSLRDRLAEAVAVPRLRTLYATL